MLPAGIILSLVALSQPLSSQAHEGKKAVGRVIRLAKALSHRTLLSAQSGKILEALVRIIVAKETKQLLPDKEDLGDSEELLATAFTTPLRQPPPVEHGDVETDTFQYSQMISRGENGLEYSQNHGFDEADDLGLFNMRTASPSETDLSESLQSVQQVIMSNFGSVLARDRSGGTSYAAATQNHYEAFGIPGWKDNVAPAVDYDGIMTLFGGAYGGLKDSGQTWIWDMNLQQ